MLEDEGIKIICKGNWKVLKAADIGQNKITEIGIEYLIKADWQHI